MSPTPPGANEAGADLSHALERLAMTLAADYADEFRAVATLQALAGGDKAAVALAMSYVLRRQELGEDVVLAEAAAALLRSTLTGPRI